MRGSALFVAMISFACSPGAPGSGSTSGDDGSSGDGSESSPTSSGASETTGVSSGTTDDAGTSETGAEETTGDGDACAGGENNHVENGSCVCDPGYQWCDPDDVSNLDCCVPAPGPCGADPLECDPCVFGCDRVLPDAIDCGLVDPSSTDDEWQFAHDCAMDALAQQVGFKVTFRFYGFDSLLTYSFGAVEGGIYLPFQIYGDTYGVGAQLTDCMDLEATMGCSPSSSTGPCMQCIGPGTPVVLCEW